MLVATFVQLYLIAAVTLLFSGYKLRRARLNSRFKADAPHVPDEDLPTVSVCLPARNETNAMTACLESVLGSNYPKLEVIVLDDNSNDNTSHLIKAFAHGGVRFIKGDPLPEDWLGKNFALETLLDDASGRYVMFMDVDTQLSVSSIRLAVEHLLENQKTMVSIIPQRHDLYRPSAWFGTLRYFWEIVLGNQTKPGASSATWLIDRQILRDELGGFGLWRDEVQPELHVAHEMAKTDEYSMLISTPELGIHYEKKWSSQVETGRRLLLPRFHNSTLSALIGIGLLCSVLLPQLIIILAILEGAWWLLWAQAALGLLSVLVFVSFCRLVWLSRIWIGVLVAPIVAWQELALLISSVVGYRMGTITWKGRPVKRPTRKRAIVSS